jgi:hypothetical protein
VSDWRDRVDRLLYDGERVTETVDTGGGRLVVTTHRLLAFTPEGNGANFRAVDRPNVDGVGVQAGGNGRYLRWTIRPLLLGGILLLAGTQLDVGDPLSGVDTSGAEGTGTGGILSTVSEFTSLLAVLDDLMVLAGAVCLLVVAAVFGLYLYSRETNLVVGVAGGDDVELPYDRGGRAPATRLETALRSEAIDDDGGEVTPEDPGGAPPIEAPSGGDDPLGVEDVLPPDADAGDEGK